MLALAQKLMQYMSRRMNKVQIISYSERLIDTHSYSKLLYNIYLCTMYMVGLKLDGPGCFQICYTINQYFLVLDRKSLVKLAAAGFFVQL